MSEKAADISCSSLLGTTVDIAFGSFELHGIIRAIGDKVSMPKPGASGEASFRQVVIDLGGRAAPLELWLADEEFGR
ncbi:hypothetical protein GCM10008965_21050 [Methylorubrum aminovorans]|nr:hypothetical protein GCM10025880_08380 [Methylorubrum aminovorans]